MIIRSIGTQNNDFDKRCKIDSTVIYLNRQSTDIPTFETNTSAPDPTGFTNPFFMFLKNELANVSNVKGYYAKAKMETDATNKVELFAVGSEIALSSK